MSHKSWRAKLALALTSGAITLAAVALLGEAVARYRERHRTTVPGTMPTLFYQHSRLRFALVRHSDYFGWIHIDGQGFRGPDVSLERRPGTLRILAAGGSTTFDVGVSGDDRAWPARLEYWIKTLAPDRPVEVINAGVPGYLVADDLIRLETDVYRYHPDIIILYQGHNDLFGTLRWSGDPPQVDVDRPGETPAVAPFNRWLYGHSLLYSKLLSRWGVIRFQWSGRRPETKHRPEVLDIGAAEFERYLTSFIAVAQSSGIQVVLPEVVHVSGVGVVHEPDPHLVQAWRVAMPFSTTDVVLQGYVRYNQVLGAVAARFRCVYIPTGGFGLAGADWYAEGDPIHFNDRGADRWAHQLAGALLTSGVLGKTGSSARAVP